MPSLALPRCRAFDWSQLDAQKMCMPSKAMLHHGWFVATSFAIVAQGATRVESLGLLMCMSGMCSGAYWACPVETGHFECFRFVLDVIACCALCACILWRRLVVSPSCCGWTGAAALWCASSWMLGVVDGGSSARQRLAHFAMHVGTLFAIADLG